MTQPIRQWIVVESPGGRVYGPYPALHLAEQATAAMRNSPGARGGSTFSIQTLPAGQAALPNPLPQPFPRASGRRATNSGAGDGAGIAVLLLVLLLSIGILYIVHKALTGTRWAQASIAVTVVAAFAVFLMIAYKKSHPNYGRVRLSVR